jgi:16S rRNA processing protein RimM
LSNEPERGLASGSPDENDIIIGKVVSVNVPRREVRIAPETSHPERFHLLRQLRLKTKENRALILPVVSVRVTRQGVIARIDSENADEIAAARGATVFVPRSERFPLPRDEYYIDDLLGLVVKDPGGRVVGRVAEVWRTPANDIYQVLDEAGREFLVPAVEDVVITIDLERGEMIANIAILE